MWQFYILKNASRTPPRTYAGVSPDPFRRLRQHNGEIKGGAKYTTKYAPGWKHICIIHGFPTKVNALQFEWAVKHTKGGHRIDKLCRILGAEKWTRNAPPAETIPLHVEWHDISVDISPQKTYLSYSTSEKKGVREPIDDVLRYKMDDQPPFRVRNVHSATLERHILDG